MIYFVQAGANGPVKIGKAVDVAQRLRQLQTGAAEPLRLLAVIPGDARTEAAIHRELAAFRTRGEWFAPVPEVFALIERRRVIETEESGPDIWPVLRRATAGERCHPCPFCGVRHQHGEPDGHRGAHCNETAVHPVTLPDGRVLRPEDGYMVRTGPSRFG